MAEPTISIHTHYNPWGRWQDIALYAHWSDPGFFAVYLHDGFSDSNDARAGSNQLDPWFQLYKYNFKTYKWEAHATELPNIPLAKWVNWRELYGIAPFPNIYWTKAEGEYPGWTLNYGFESLGAGRILGLGAYIHSYDSTTVPATSHERAIAFTSDDDANLWTTKEHYDVPINLQYRCDLPEVSPVCNVYALQKHQFSWDHPRYIGNNAIMQHRTLYMQSNNIDGVTTGGPMWGFVDYQELDKVLTNYELDKYTSKNKDDANDTNWKTWTGVSGNHIKNAWHLSRVCYCGEQGDVFLDVDVDPPVVAYKKVMVCVCFNRHVLVVSANGDDYYVGNVQRGTWRTMDGGKNWDYLGPILNDGASWDETTTTQQWRYQPSYHQLEYLGGGRILGLFTVSIGTDMYAVRSFISEDLGVSWTAHGLAPFSTRIYPWFHKIVDPESPGGLPKWLWPQCRCRQLNFIGTIKRMLPLKRHQLKEDQDFVFETIVMAEIYWTTPPYDIENGWDNVEYIISKDGGETWTQLEGDVPIRNESKMSYGTRSDLPATWLEGEIQYQNALSHMDGVPMWQQWNNLGFVPAPEALLSTLNNGAVPSLSREWGETGEVYDVLGKPTGNPAVNDFEHEIVILEVIPAESVI